MPENLTEGYDEQDQAETFDEDMVELDGEMRTAEEQPALFDVTSAEGDADDEEALIGEDLDDDEIIALEEDAVDADADDER